MIHLTAMCPPGFHPALVSIAPLGLFLEIYQLEITTSGSIATPRHATPRHATPRHATPRHGTARHGTALTN
ncbi:hypothetical protein JO972_04480 [Verrucomicrobiaceae bacterium 5K15]|uniref:Uncharacterized protein n=1 Tax=Oceaniferula flava TaxID=2800421 RepID=A0AAE2SC39_9BACT|nr:hypothetical protein [Oceaniferula flavus]MBK1854199.1 hypothetical protein [Oceaniferula flavus]MBM1135505.1 hypothetical protein [Oceaniferula flavus]